MPEKKTIINFDLESEYRYKLTLGVDIELYFGKTENIFKIILSKKNIMYLCSRFTGYHSSVGRATD